jgi:bacteriocin-like protein
MKNSIIKFRENKIFKKLTTRELSLIVGGSEVPIVVRLIDEQKK